MDVPALKSAMAATARDEKALFIESSWLTEHAPNVFALLAYPENAGAPREPSSLRLFVDQGRLKWVVNDPTSGMCCFVTLDGSTCFLTQLERVLAADQADWREQKKPPHGKKSWS